MLLQVEKNVLQNLRQIRISNTLVVTVPCACSEAYLSLSIACVLSSLSIKLSLSCARLLTDQCPFTLQDLADSSSHFFFPLLNVLS